MEYNYKPKGVCSINMKFEIEEDRIKDLEIERGCPGNLMGIAHLVKGEKIDSVIQKLKGIKCGFRETSCPDQIARALIQYKEKRNK